MTPIQDRALEQVVNAQAEYLRIQDEFRKSEKNARLNLVTAMGRLEMALAVKGKE